MTAESSATSNNSGNWKNVNNWHWIEKDCTAWSHAQLNEILPGLEASIEGYHISITSVHELRGEVSVAQSKGRLRQIYDLSFDLSFQSASTTTGTISVTDLMSDTEPADLEYTVKIDTTGSTGSREGLLRALKGFVRETLWKAVHETFGDALMAAHGQGLLVAVEGDEKSMVPRQKYTGNEDASAEIPTDKATGTIEMQVEFNAATPADIFRALTDPSMVRVWSRTADPGPLLPGTRFGLFSGAVTGEILEADPTNHQLTMTWKLAAWPEPSTVRIQINDDDDDGGSILHLHQEHLPKAEVEGTRVNWTNYYWNPIKSVFGYGAVSFL